MSDNKKDLFTDAIEKNKAEKALMTEFINEQIKVNANLNSNINQLLTEYTKNQDELEERLKTIDLNNAEQVKALTLQEKQNLESLKSKINEIKLQSDNNNSAIETALRQIKGASEGDVKGGGGGEGASDSKVSSDGMKKLRNRSRRNKLRSRRSRSQRRNIMKLIKKSRRTNKHKSGNILVVKKSRKKNH